MPVICRTSLRILVPLLLWTMSSVRVSAQAIIEACKRNDLAAVQRLLKENPRVVGVKDHNRDTPLHFAANQGNLQIMQLLLDYRADVNAREYRGLTPMVAASEVNQPAAMQMLLDHGGDLEARGNDGNAPIHFAAKSGAVESINYLLSNGVAVDVPNGDGNTPLAVAAWYGNMLASQMLMACGADLRIKNKFGKTALDEANRSGKRDISQMLAGYQQALDDRAARDLVRKTSGLNLRTTYAAWLDHKAVTKTVYNEDFHGDRPGPEWKNSGGVLPISTTPIGGRRFMGEFGNSAVVLTLLDLPEHQEIAISFDLFMIRSMDGNLPNIGPDFWSLRLIDGPSLIETTFANLRTGISPRMKIQSYPGEYPGDANESCTGAIETNTLGYKFKNDNVPSMDSVYRMRYTFSSTSRAILFRFAGGNLQEADDESWGITNVQVAVGVAPASAATAVRPVPAAKPGVHAASHIVTARPVPSHRIIARRAAPKLITRAVRRPKPASKPKTTPAVKRIHNKKVAPTP